MQDSTFLPQHRVSTLALTLSVAAFSVIGCAHDPAPEPRSARVESTERAPMRTEQRTQQAAIRQEDRVVADGDRDREAPGPATAMDQSNEPADLEITRRIRAAVVTDAALSVGARNCVIITRDSVVTLRGNVSQDEKQRIATHAQAVPGVSRVENLLAIDP